MKKFIFSGMITVLLSGCSLIPDYKTPPVETPKQWSSASPSQQTQIAVDWWKSFSSGELNGLIETALAENNDLHASLQRIEQARADLKIAGAGLLPSADASTGLSWTKTNPATGRTTSGNSWNAGPDISYELDLFGGNRADVASASAQYNASRFTHDALALTIMGDVATGYFTVLNLRERLAIARNDLKNARDTLAIVNARFNAGAISALDPAQQKAAVASAEASLAALEQQETKAVNALSVLLGKPPQSIIITGQNLKSLTVPAIAAGQPSQLLTRRPDIRSAELDLYAANADIGAARAAFFPVVTLGLDWSIRQTPIGDPAATALSLASALTTPLFRGGSLRGGVEKATARQMEMAEDYRKTVLTAFQEVEDALTDTKAAQVRQAALKTAMEESQRAYDLSLAQYKAGAVDFQTVLDSQALLFISEDAYARTRLAALSAAINLFRALGGGWTAQR